MNRRILPRDSHVYQEDGFWKLRWRGDSPNANGSEARSLIEPVLLGPAEGAGKLTQTEAGRIGWIACNYFLSELQRGVLAKQSKMTVAEFVEHKFVPEHIASMRYSGRAHYQAILKHVLRPEEVDHVFQIDGERSRTKLKTIPDWPYLSNVRLCDAHPDHVQGLVSAALKQGYAPQTVKHIRNVVSAIFSCAMREQCYVGENPASSVKPSEHPGKNGSRLTLAETREVLGAMSYPEKEMALLALLTDLNVVEICGLQWKNVNLGMVQKNVDGETILARTIAVKKQWYRGALGGVKKSRVRNISIPQPLLQILIGLLESTEIFI